MTVAFPRHWPVFGVSVPVVLDWLALKNCHENIKGVEYTDDAQKHDDRDALPVVVDAQPQQEDANHEFDNC